MGVWCAESNDSFFNIAAATDYCLLKTSYQLRFEAAQSRFLLKPIPENDTVEGSAHAADAVSVDPAPGLTFAPGFRH